VSYKDSVAHLANRIGIIFLVGSTYLKPKSR